MSSSTRTAGPPDAIAPRRKVRPAEPLAFRVEHSTDRHMNLTTDRRMSPGNEQEPFSLSELATGSTAVAAVALIAFLGARAFQPPNPPPAYALRAAPSPDAVPSASADVSQRRRHVPTATARARQGLPPPNDVAMRLPESSAADSPASSPPASNAAATKKAATSNFLVEAAPATVVEMQSPQIGGPPPPLIGPSDLFRTKDAISVRPSDPIRATAIAPPPEAERNPSNRSDAVWVQTKLHELGYFAGNGNGIWGQASRNALRDFKAMNGLAEDDKWDRETEQRLASKQNVPASSTFIGGWAQSVEECQRFRGIGAPLVIRSRGAETDGVRCSFRSIKRELATAWRIQAACSAGGQSWNANVSLKLAGTNLNWSSENGKEIYVRCVKP
jgi:Putative peptidoglycan binding domain